MSEDNKLLWRGIRPTSEQEHIPNSVSWDGGTVLNLEATGSASGNVFTANSGKITLISSISIHYDHIVNAGWRLIHYNDTPTIIEYLYRVNGGIAGIIALVIVYTDPIKFAAGDYLHVAETAGGGNWAVNCRGKEYDV